MYSLGLLALTSFLLALLLTPLCRNLFRRWGLGDWADEGTEETGTGSTVRALRLGQWR